MDVRPDINKMNTSVYLFILVVVVFFFFFKKCQICTVSLVLLVIFAFLGSKYHVFNYYGFANISIWRINGKIILFKFQNKYV